MRLLVSVADEDEAVVARNGGADIVDAKDPTRGALMPVALATFARIRAAVGNGVPVSAAIGDAADEASTARLARDFAGAGASFVKVGFVPGCSHGRAEALLAAAVERASPTCRVVAVVYADDHGSIAESDWIGDVARRAGATGVLLDTRDKNAPGLGSRTERSSLRAWVSSMTSRSLEVALAGRLSLHDLELVREAGAHIVGVRGAACADGRTGRVRADLVARLRARCDLPMPSRETVARLSGA